MIGALGFDGGDPDLRPVPISGAPCGTPFEVETRYNIPEARHNAVAFERQLLKMHTEWETFLREYRRTSNSQAAWN
ncbi:hypothetical protein Ct61P_05593 [Colletotrichum tofieldiae]|nr:hypothetical protein Ct61P_05593 [Colletotrichum tofieldiae]